MSKAHAAIRRAVETFLDERMPATTSYATIESVDEAKRTCTAKIGNISREGILLYAVTQDSLKGVCVFPKVGSRVLVANVGEGRSFVTMCSEVDKVVVTIGDKTGLIVSEQGVEVAAEQVVFNGGDNGAMVKIEELKKNLESLQDYVEAMNAALPTAFDAILKSTAADGGLGAASYRGAMAGKEITLSEMGNDKVKH